MMTSVFPVSRDGLARFDRDETLKVNVRHCQQVLITRLCFGHFTRFPIAARRIAVDRIDEHGMQMMFRSNKAQGLGRHSHAS